MKSQKLSAFEEVSSNLDILKYLFDYFDIGDQLRFANISEQLRFVFRNFIWQEVQFKKVTIKKYSHTIRLTNNNDNNNAMAYDLTYEEYEYFLNIFGPHVEVLNESHGIALNISLQLTNLTSIKYSYLLITKQQIQLLAEVCPQLEKLFINGCCNKRHEILRLGFDIDIHFLLAMTRMKSFSLKTGLDYKIKYGFCEDLQNKRKLRLNSSSRLENLNIYMSTLATSFLSLFSQLQTLTVTFFYAVTNKEMIALSVACQQLKELSFHFTSFKNIDRFSVLQSLSDLMFYHCEGLTYENLRDILTRSQLVTFTSIGTKYEGLFHYYFLAPTIKSAYIDAIKSFDFKTELEFYAAKEKCVL